MITLPNVLTTEERLATTRLFDHDMTGILHGIYGAMSSAFSGNVNEHRKKRAIALGESFASFYRTVNRLTQNDTISIDGMFSKDSTQGFIEDMEDCSYIFGENFCLEAISNYSKIPVRAGDMTYCILHNLVKNSVWAGAKSVNVLIEPSSFPESASFIPDGARNYKDFIAFRVHDNGRGFPSREAREYGSYFTTCPPKGEHGFGLYFTGLVAKVLRAPVEIKSVPGDTTVSFYHPVYERAK